MIAGMSLYRDLHAFYAAKDKLFSERTSGLIFFENMMGIFFSGRDLTEDIMAQPKPEVRLVVAGQQYDKAAGDAQVQIPAFAAIFRLKQPKQYADVIESAWQKAVGLINFTRSQKAEVGLVIDRLTYHDTRYTVAYFPTLPDAEKTVPGTESNFGASLVKMGDYLVLSSTEGLAKDLIDALQKETSEKTRPLAGVHTAVDFDGGQLSAVLEANRRTLVRGNMVEKGNSQETGRDGNRGLDRPGQVPGPVQSHLRQRQARPAGQAYCETGPAVVGQRHFGTRSGPPPPRAVGESG